MQSMNNETISAIAKLAVTTAEYESAWRLLYKTVPNSMERAEADDALSLAYRAQVEAQKILAENLGDDVAHAITGALIQATARTGGERPSDAAIATPVKFIRNCINGQAGV